MSGRAPWFTTSLLGLATLVACGRIHFIEIDGGSGTRLDASTRDASRGDGGASDAGRPRLDAGSDAGLLDDAGRSGKLTSDPDTLLLLHFDDSLTGVAGETPVRSDVTFEPGRIGSGVALRVGTVPNVLQYAASGNISFPEGTIEFWIKPSWAGSDSVDHVFFRWNADEGDTLAGAFVFMKDAANNLRFLFNTSAPGGLEEQNIGWSVTPWLPDTWHHLAITWNATEMALFVDGTRAATNIFTSSRYLPTATYINIGLSSTGIDVPHRLMLADAVLDEFRVSNRAHRDDQILASFMLGSGL